MAVSANGYRARFSLARQGNLARECSRSHVADTPRLKLAVQSCLSDPEFALDIRQGELQTNVSID
jgi:hypothetical protein